MSNVYKMEKSGTVASNILSFPKCEEDTAASFSSVLFRQGRHLPSCAPKTFATKSNHNRVEHDYDLYNNPFEINLKFSQFKKIYDSGKKKIIGMINISRQLNLMEFLMTIWC